MSYPAVVKQRAAPCCRAHNFDVWTTRHQAECIGTSKLNSYLEKLKRAFHALSSRLFFAASTSVLHLMLIYSVKRAEEAGGLEFPLSPMYLVFLYLDLSFHSTYDFRRRSDLKYNFITQVLIFLPVVPLYAFLSSWDHVARYPVLIPGILLAICIARSFHSIAGLLYLYDKALRSIAITQASVLALQMIFFTMGLAGVISSELQIVLQFLSFGMPFLYLRPSMKWTIQFNLDFLIVVLVLIDFVRNQYVFIQFSNTISSTELANIMFVRSILGPLVLIIASRRKAIEDAVINGQIERPNFFLSSLPIYGLALLAPLPIAAIGFDLATALAWAVTLIIQDYRAHVVRIGLSTKELPPRFAALNSGISLGFVFLLFSFLNGFYIYFLALPAIVDLVTLMLIHTFFQRIKHAQ